MANNKCPDCDADLMTAQVAMHFNVTATGSNERLEFPVNVGICTKCGRMNVELAQPGPFKEWLDNAKHKSPKGDSAGGFVVKSQKLGTALGRSRK